MRQSGFRVRANEDARPGMTHLVELHRFFSGPFAISYDALFLRAPPRSRTHSQDIICGGQRQDVR
jgi:hypothetical protein